MLFLTAEFEFVRYSFTSVGDHPHR